MRERAAEIVRWALARSPRYVLVFLAVLAGTLVVAAGLGVVTTLVISGHLVWAVVAFCVFVSVIGTVLAMMILE